jgi:hypothetical protein
VCADGLQGLSAFHCPIQLLTFLFDSLQLLANFVKILTEFLLRIPFSVIGRMFSRTKLSLVAKKSARINLSQAASGMILQNQKRLPVSMFIVKITA